MKFLLMMNTAGGAYQHTEWLEQDWKRHMAFLNSFNKKLGEAGELVAILALRAPDQAKRVRAGDDGRPITDGVFPESEGVPRGILDGRCRYTGPSVSTGCRSIGRARAGR